MLNLKNKSEKLVHGGTWSRMLLVIFLFWENAVTNVHFGRLRHCFLVAKRMILDLFFLGLIMASVMTPTY